MSSVIRRAKAVRGDLALWDGRATSATRPDASGGTITGLPIGMEVDVLQVYGNGTDRTDAAIATALRNIAALPVTLVFSPGTWSITADITIPSTVTCHIPRGCVFDVSSGKTLTFSGALQRESNTWTSGAGTVTYTRANNVLVHTNEIAALSQDMAIIATYGITAGETLAAVTPSNYAYPPGFAERFGGSPSASAATNALAFQNVLDSRENLQFATDGTWDFNTGLLIKFDGQQIIGRGRYGKTVLNWTGNTNSTLIGNSGTTVRNGVVIRDIGLSFNSNGCIAIDYSHFDYSTFEHLAITAYGSNTRGTYAIGRSTGDRPYYNVFNQIDIASNNILGVTSGSVGHYLDRVLVSGVNYNGPNANRYQFGRVYGADYLVKMLDGNGNVFTGIVGESIKVAHYDFGTATHDVTATATGGTINTLTTTGLTADIYLGGALEITSGTGSGQIRNVTGNTTTAITVFPYWRVIPDNTSVFKLYINQGGGNVVRDAYCEGDAPSNPTFLHLRPGVTQTRLQGGTQGSLGTGAVVTADCPRVDDVFEPNTWKQPFPLRFYALDLAASQTNLALTPAGETRNNLQAAFTWAVIAIDTNLTGVIVAGKAELWVTDDGTKKNTTSDVLLNSGNTFNANGGSIRNDVFSQTAIVGGGAGRGLGLVVTTDGSWSPTNSDLHVTLWVQPR